MMPRRGGTVDVYLHGMGGQELQTGGRGTNGEDRGDNYCEDGASTPNMW